LRCQRVAWMAPACAGVREQMDAARWDGAHEFARAVVVEEREVDQVERIADRELLVERVSVAALELVLLLETLHGSVDCAADARLDVRADVAQSGLAAGRDADGIDIGDVGESAIDPAPAD